MSRKSRSRTRRIAIGPAVASAAAISFAAMILLPSCGPTKTGKEMRAQANDRFDRVGAGVAHEQSRQALESGQYSEALAHSDRAISRFPEYWEYRLMRGRILLEMRRLEGALQEISQAEQLNPSCAPCAYYEGVIRQRLNDDTRALAAYQRALATEPSNPHYALAVAETLVAMDQLAAAELFIEDIECRFEYLPAFVHLKAELHASKGDPAAAHKLIERARAVAAEPEKLDEDLAVAAFRAGRWEDCLSVIGTSALLDPATMPDVARMRARCLAHTGRAVQARDELLAFEQRTGESTVEHLDALAEVCWMAGDMRRAEQAASTLVARDPESVDGYLLLGAVAQARGEIDAASRAFARAAELDPSRQVAADMARRSEAARLALGGLAANSPPQ